jgi:hypothetical protein
MKSMTEHFDTQPSELLAQSTLEHDLLQQQVNGIFHAQFAWQ